MSLAPDKVREKIAPIRPKGAKDLGTVSTVLAGIKYQIPDNGDMDLSAEYEQVAFEWLLKATGWNRGTSKKYWKSVKPGNFDDWQDVLDYHAQAEARRTRFKLFEASQVEAAPAIDWRLKLLFPEQGIVAVVGPSGSGKSFLVSHISLAIASGTPFFGYATKPGAVVYLVLEGEAGFPTRIAAWRVYHGVPAPDNIRFSCQPFNLLDPQDVVDLAALCPPGCTVIIDTAFLAAPGLDENSAKDMSRFIAGAKLLQRLIAGLVILVAHTGKDEAKGLRGHSSLFAALDAVITVGRDGDARKWKLTKAKDGKDGEEHGFRLPVIELGTDADGDPVTSCVVVPDRGATQQFTKPLTGYGKLGLSTLENAARAYGVLDTAGQFIGVPLRQWRGEFYRKCPAENDDAKRKAFNRARNELTTLGHIEVDNDVYRFAGLNATAKHAVLAAMLAGQPGHGGTLP